MSSSDRRTFLIALAGLPLAACGFTPAYAPGGPAAGLMGQVRAEDPPNREAFDLVGRLEERLGTPSGGARYSLGYRIETREMGVAITPDNTITRYNITGSVAFTLKDAATGKVLTSGKVSNFTAYSATGTTVATLSAREDARHRLMVILADDIVTRLIASAGDWHE